MICSEAVNSSLFSKMIFHTHFLSFTLLLLSVISLSFEHEATDQQTGDEGKSLDGMITRLVGQATQSSSEESVEKIDELTRGDWNTKVGEDLHRQKRQLGLTCRAGGNRACVARCRLQRSRTGYCNRRGTCVCRR
ncbi:uncharacterized protein LOC119640475 [Glossina fuscipes]|uniref:Uncharacterized protein LOC119640475 n=1 Tax=Glossina fuscipes TaxID=7396 RepID=A0A9C6DZD7_9MUSC|nr:uncharacterized protein LOC119640475 [Glossina fuscipes]